MEWCWFAGGYNPNGGAPLASAELYNPDSLVPAGLVSIAVTPPPNPTLSGSTQQFIANRDVQRHEYATASVGHVEFLERRHCHDLQ